jgi:predicted transcriptional regulator
MKTLTITVSDKVAESLAETAAEAGRPAEELAAQAIEETFGPDWFDELDDKAQISITKGVAEAERADFATDAAVEEAFARFKR